MENIKKRSIVLILILSLLAGLFAAMLPVETAAANTTPSVENGSRLSEYTDNGEFMYSSSEMAASDFIPAGVEGGDTFSTKIPKVAGVDGMMVIDMSSTPIDVTDYYTDDPAVLESLSTQTPQVQNLAVDFWFYATNKESEGSLGGATLYVWFGNGFYAYDMHDKGPDGVMGNADDSSVIKNYQPRTWVHYRLLVARGTFGTNIGYEFTKLGFSGSQTIDNTYYIYNPKLIVYEHNQNGHKNNDAYFTALETKEVTASGIDMISEQTGLITSTTNTMTLNYDFAAVSEDDPSALPTAAKSEITLTSSDTSVATIGDNGLINLLKPGNTNITATYGSMEKVCALTVLRGVDTVAVNGSNTGKVGGTIQLTAAVSPAEASQTVSWKSSNSRTASVDNDGLVTLLKAGKVTITATATDGSNIRGTLEITVTDVEAESISLDKTTYSGTVGGSVTLVASLTPDGVTQTVTFESSNPGVATVDNEGKVTLVGVGEATITAKCGDKTATCAVTVYSVMPGGGDGGDGGDGNNAGGDKGGLSGGAIAAIVIGACAVVGGAAAAVVVMKKKKG